MILLSKAKSIRAVRIIIALMLTFAITSYYNIPEGVWALITNVVVLYDNTTIGGVSSRSYLRFMGTLLAAIYGAFFVYFFANNLVTDLIALALGVFVFAYFYMDDKKMYIGVLGTATLTFVLLNYNDLEAMVLRPFNIGLGIVVAYLTLRFFYPQYARNAVMEIMTEVLKNLEQMLRSPVVDEVLQKEQTRIENKFIGNINKYNRYMDEAVSETKQSPMFVKYCQSILIHIKRVYRINSVFVFHLSAHAKNYSQVEQLLVDKIILVTTELTTLLETKVHDVDINAYHQLAAEVKIFMQRLSTNEDTISSQALFFEIFKELDHLINDLYELNAIRLTYKYY